MTNLSITKPQQLQEINPCSVIYGYHGDIIDIADLTSKTPFDDLMAKEERDMMEATLDHREAQISAISGLLSYLFKNTDPLHICIRAYLLAYTVNPSLLDFGGTKITLESIGKKLGGLKKATVSKHLQDQDKTFPIKRRGKKSDATKAKYSDIAKKVWKNRKETKG